MINQIVSRQQSLYHALGKPPLSSAFTGRTRRSSCRGKRSLPLRSARSRQCAIAVSGATACITNTFGAGHFTAPRWQAAFHPLDTACNIRCAPSSQNDCRRRLPCRGEAGRGDAGAGDNNATAILLSEAQLRALLVPGRLEFRLLPNNFSVEETRTRHRLRSSINKRAWKSRRAMPSTPRCLCWTTVITTGSRLEYDYTGKPDITFSLNGEDNAKRFGTITERNIGRKLAIVIDGKIITAPVIEARMSEPALSPGISLKLKQNGWRLC